jgi:hypothetical protein
MTCEDRGESRAEVTTCDYCRPAISATLRLRCTTVVWTMVCLAGVFHGPVGPGRCTLRLECANTIEDAARGVLCR